MHLTTSWIVALATAGAGAGALAAVAAAVRHDVSELQRSLRPLRVPSRRAPRVERPR